jgi:hypothetical protein
LPNAPVEKVIPPEEVNFNNINNDLLQKKRKPNKNLIKELPTLNLTYKNSNTIGVKLVCDNDNEELKKYFSKTVRMSLI